MTSRPIILLFLLFSIFSFGQNSGVEIKVYGFEEGLTHRNVFKIAQDPQGFIWIATINGLNKFDGHNFVQYNSTEKEYNIPYDYVSDMLIDKDSMIWMSNPNYLTVLNPYDNSIKKIKADSTSLVYDQPRSFNNLIFDESGKVLLSTQLSETGVSVIQRISEDDQLTDILECKGTYAKRSVIHHQGFHYISFNENELAKVDKQGKIVKTYFFSSKIENEPASAWVNAAQVTKDGTLWLLLNTGQVYFLEQGAKEFVKHPMTDAIFDKGIAAGFLVEENGDIWIGGLGNLWFFDAASGKTVNYEEAIRDILKNTCNFRQIFKDESGVIWVASDYGAIKLVKSDKVFTKYLDEGSEYCSNGFCSMRGMAEDDEGNIYFSYYNTIHVLDAQTNSLRPLFPQNNYFNFPFGLVYHDDALYTGNGKRIDLNTLNVDTLFNDEMVDLGFPMVDHENEIWIGFRKALYIYSPESGRIRNFEDTDNQIDTSKLDISYIYQSPIDSSIWLCTLGDGLYRIKKDKGVVGHYNADSTSTPRLRNNKVNGVYEDSKGFLWLGTGNGLHRWNLETNALKVFDTKSGLANNFINGLLPEGDTCVWVSTDNGLARLDLKKNSTALFFKQDGLSANEFNRASFYKSKDGRMFFGGLNGINAFQPSSNLSTSKLKKTSKVLFTGFSKLDGESDSIINRYFGLSPKKPINLSYKDRFFRFEFALADFKNPGANTYSYMLEGFEKEWSKPSQINSANYNSVPAGDYKFRVRAATGPGNWNEEELNLEVHVQEAFYKTWWFMGICFLAALAVTAGVLEYRLYMSIQREKKLEKEVKLRTQELELEKRKSDDLLLNILPAETAEELKKYGKAKAKRYDRVTVLFTDFKDFSKIAEQLSPEELVSEIDFCFRNFDEIIEKHGLEKIKTIGDAYMCVGGLPKPDENNPVNVIEAAIDIRDFMEEVKRDHKETGRLFFEIRLGVHTGDVVAGIVGTKKFVYDIWGDAVNIAARMEGNSEVGKINISGFTHQLVQDHFECTHRGKIAAKNIGEVDMFYAERKEA